MSAMPHRVSVRTANCYGDQDTHTRLVDLGAPTAMEFFQWLSDTIGIPVSLLFAQTEFHTEHQLLQCTHQLVMRRTATHLHARVWDKLALCDLHIEDGATLVCAPRQGPLLDLVDPDGVMPGDIVRTLNMRHELVLPAVEWAPGAPLPVPLPADQTALRLSRLIDRLGRWIEEVRARGALVYAAPMLLLASVFGAVRKRLADLPVSRTPHAGETRTIAESHAELQTALRASLVEVPPPDPDEPTPHQVAELEQDDIALAYALSLSQQGGAEPDDGCLLDDDTADGLLDDDADGASASVDHYCEGAACWCAAPASEDESPAAAAAAE